MITVKQMLQLERDAQKFGIFVKDLMENAGREIYATVKEKCDIEGKDIIIFCGHGNNGGDGFAAASHFTDNSVLILFFGEENKPGEEAKEWYDQVKETINIIPIKTLGDIKTFQFQPDHRLVLLDALLGTGIKGSVKDPISFGIDYFNSLQGDKVAIDIPSGMNGDTGEYEKRCDVDLTITLHDVKPGIKNENSVIVDIGLEDVKKRLTKLRTHGVSSPLNNLTE